MKAPLSSFRLLDFNLRKQPQKTLRSALPSSEQHRYRDPHHLTTRTFLAPATPPLHLHATRILPYAAAPLYALIADIAAYPAFLPFCTASAVTSWSAPHPPSPSPSSSASATTTSKTDETAETTSTTSTPSSPSNLASPRRWPRTATLDVGWAGLAESFESRVFCAPASLTLEALAGAARTTIPAAKLQHYDFSSSLDTTSSGRTNGSPTPAIREADIAANSVFKSLRTRWQLRHVLTQGRRRRGTGRDETDKEGERTEVELTIEVEWANAIYAALSQAAAPKVAGVLIEAFEKRAARVLGDGHGNVDGR